MNCPKLDLVKLVKEAYRLSAPQGLGFLHFTPSPLSTEEAKQFIIPKSTCNIVLHMDYVHGRAVKLTVKKNADGTFSLPDSWYDHTDEQYKELLEAVGVEFNKPVEHGCACNCATCRMSRN